jgi:hypothetical protein
MKYKFEQFNVEIDNPSVEVVKVSDDIKEKTCSVSILLTTDTAKFGVTLDGFTYSDTWEDAEVYAWVENELKKYAV